MHTRQALGDNVQFSGRAEARHARRRRTMATPRLRRARDAVSRSAATAWLGCAVTCVCNEHPLATNRETSTMTRHLPDPHSDKS